MENFPETRGNTTRIAREYHLLPGAYWRCIKPTSDGRNGVSEGTVLMIQQIKTVDRVAHTVCMRRHPGERWGGTRDYLLANFLDHYEPLQDSAARAVREAEMAEIQGRISEHQQQIAALHSDPSAVMAAIERERAENPNSDIASDFQPTIGLPEFGRSESGLAPVSANELALWQEQTANHAALIEARARLIERASKALTETVQSLTPFFTEQADAALAQANAIKKDVDKIYQGLHTLELYTGKDVSVQNLVEGARDESQGPYAIRQRCLYMDEESLINLYSDGADFRSLGDFAELLQTDRVLRDRLLPETRCIAAMRSRRKAKDYGDDLANIAYNGMNARVFLLVRDGERIDVVFSPLDYLPRLFPTHDDMDRPFRGFAGERITIDDVSYADRRDRQDQIILMYKRLLILLWGLYDRDELFGPFKGESAGRRLNILDLSVQDEVFDFVADDEDSRLIGSGRLGLFDWFRLQRQRLGTGSSVAGHWLEICREGEDVAPHCYTNAVLNEPAQIRRPATPCTVERVKTQSGKHYTSIPVVKMTSIRDEDKTTQARVNLEPRYGRIGSLDMLVLDGLTADDIRARFHAHDARENYLTVLPILLTAHARLRAWEETYAACIGAVRESMGKIAPEPPDCDDWATRATVLAMVKRRKTPSDVSVTSAFVRSTTQIALACNALGEKYESLPIEQSAKDAPTGVIGAWLAQAGVDETRVIRVSIDHHARLVIGMAPQSDRMDELDWPAVEIVRMAFPMADGQIKSGAEGESESVLMSNPGNEQIALWQRRSARDRGERLGRPPAAETPGRDTIDFWMQRAKTAPPIKSSLIPSQRQTAEQSIAEFLALLEGEGDPGRVRDLVQAAILTQLNDSGGRESLVHPPRVSVPIAIFGTPFMGRREPEPCWLCVDLDAMTFIYSVGDEPIRERVLKATDQIYRDPSSAIKKIKAGPVGRLSMARLGSIDPRLSIRSSDDPNIHGATDIGRTNNKEPDFDPIWSGLGKEAIEGLSTRFEFNAHQLAILEKLLAASA